MGELEAAIDGGVVAYLGLIRYRNCAMSSVAAFLGAFVVTGRSIIHHLPSVGVAMVVVFAFTGAGNALNDYLDADIDRTAHPDRPLPSGRIERVSARNISALLFAVAVILSVPIGTYSIAIVLLSLALMLSYEFRLKKSGVSGNITIAWLTASLFLYGAAAVGSIIPIWAFFATSFLATAGREIIKDVQDVEADRGIRRTLPMQLGNGKAMMVSSTALAGAIAISPFPFILHQFGYLFLGFVLAADAVFAYTAALQWKSASRAQGVAKAAMYIALLAFLVGALEV